MAEIISFLSPSDLMTQTPKFYVQVVLWMAIIWVIFSNINLPFDFIASKPSQYGTTKLVRRIQGVFAELSIIGIAFIFLSITLTQIAGDKLTEPYAKYKQEQKQQDAIQKLQEKIAAQEQNAAMPDSILKRAELYRKAKALEAAKNDYRNCRRKYSKQACLDLLEKEAGEKPVKDEYEYEYMRCTTAYSEEECSKLWGGRELQKNCNKKYDNSLISQQECIRNMLALSEMQNAKSGKVEPLNKLQ